MSKLRPRSGRTPLQPKNSDNHHHSSSSPNPKPIPKPNPVLIDKENRREMSDATAAAGSLGDELEAIKKKMERMRMDRERTEKMLEERGRVMDAKMKELEERGEVQKMMEIQVDRLFRLKELKSRCMRVSPIRTLREKEQLKIGNESPSPSKIAESDIDP
ncbi:hypothetical protein RIF29_00110 [Crotalaria pallida]|uniref:Uncharacterized protein n=1 Tax=Crotalaria pallida TaxID=3830 RepID=A0AAN9IW76_CROPI